MDKNDEFKKILSILKQAIHPGTEAERKPAIQGFVKKWSKNGEAVSFPEFIAWLGKHEDYEKKPEDLRQLLEQGRDILKEACPEFSTQAGQYLDSYDQESKRAEKQNILNGICTLLNAATQSGQSGQNSSAKSFEDSAGQIAKEHGIGIEEVNAYRQERQKVLLSLFQKADTLGQLGQNPAKANIEAEFSILGQQYGFIQSQEDGGSTTTDEFNTAYQEYMADREAYIQAHSGNCASAASAQTFSDVSSDDDTVEDNGADDPLQAAHNNPPQSEPIKKVRLFPMRDVGGNMLSVTSADNYTSALKEAIEEAPWGAASLTLDFPSGPIATTTSKFNIVQNSDAQGWNISDGWDVSWKAAAPEVGIKDTTIKTDKGELKLGTVIRSSVEVREEGEITLSGPAIDTTVTAGEKVKINIRGNLENGHIKTSGNLVFENKSVMATGTTFEGYIPRFPQTELALFQKVIEQAKLSLIPEAVQAMEQFLQHALCLGNSGYYDKTEERAKALWPITSKPLTVGEEEIFSTFFMALEQGYKANHLSLELAPDTFQKWHAFEESAKSKTVSLFVYPLFTNSKEDLKLREEPQDIKSEHHYRLIFIADTEKDIAYDQSHTLFGKEADQYGYPPGFWEWEKKYSNTFSVDLGAPPMHTGLQPLSDDAGLGDEASHNILEKILTSSWAKEHQRTNLFRNLEGSFLMEEKIEATKRSVKSPLHKKHRNRNGLCDEGARPYFQEAGKILRRISKGFNQDLLGSKIITQGVFQDCTFLKGQENFYTNGMPGNRFQEFNAIVHGEGDLTRTHYQKSDMQFYCLNDIQIGSATVTEGSDIKFSPSPFCKNDRLTVNAENISILGVGTSLNIDSVDAIRAGKAKVEDTKIRITGSQEVDLSQGNYKNCTIKIDDVKKLVLNGAVLESCQIEINTDSVDFTGVKMLGKTVLKGKTKSAIFKGASIGSSIADTKDSLSFELQANKGEYSNAAFGNVRFVSDVNIENMTGENVKVTGRVSASGETAEILYSLFGTAVNLEETIPASELSDQDSLPAQVFSL